MPLYRFSSTSLLAAALLMVGAACASPDPGVGGGDGDGFPLVVQALDGPVTIPAQPERIVSISPTATEMLFAIGAGPQVTAVDDQSNHPEDAPQTDLSGFTPNLEAIAAYDPDLVLLDTDTGDIVSSLRAIDIPVLRIPAADTLEETYEQITQLGLATGNLTEAERVVSSMRSQIERILEDAPDFDRSVTYYHELDNTYYSATSSTFIGYVYGLFGLENIADAADNGGTGYPQLSAEYILESDPDIIFLANAAYGESHETVAARPGWSTMTAVRNRAVVELDADISSRWGPRIVDHVRIVAGTLAELRPAA